MKFQGKNNWNNITWDSDYRNFFYEIFIISRKNDFTFRQGAFNISGTDSWSWQPCYVKCEIEILDLNMVLNRLLNIFKKVGLRDFLGKLCFFSLLNNFFHVALTDLHADWRHHDYVMCTCNEDLTLIKICLSS